MSTSHDVIDLRARRDELPGAAELRDEWGRISRERLGLGRQQWHHPVTADLVQTLLTGADTGAALTRFAEARAGAGISLADTLADLAVLDEALSAGGHAPVGSLDNLSTAARLADGWVAALDAKRAPAHCVDELTGLVTPSFLEARLHQIYRHCDFLGVRPADAYGLVVAQIDRHRGSPFTGVAQRLRLAGDLRLCFPGSDTLAAFEPTELSQTMVALTSRAPDLATAVETLANGTGQRSVRIAVLPDDVHDAVALVRTLPRISE